MQLYRFSPIDNQDQLLQAIEYTHAACHKLCKQSLGKYLPVAGNIGIFCHYDDEFDKLKGTREALTEPSDDPNQKYFKLHQPIVAPAVGDIPATKYTHLYVRRPDIYRAQVGDIDFYLAQEAYDELKQSLATGKHIPGARIFPRQDLDMIELYDPDIDALGYVSTHTMTEKVRIKLSSQTT